MTSLKVNSETVVEIATRGGRERWRIESEGFNAKKTDGMNIEHAYSHKNDAAYYLLMQIAHLVIQLVEKGSLLRQLAQECGQWTAAKLLGGLKIWPIICWIVCVISAGLTRCSMASWPGRSRSGSTPVRRVKSW